MPPLARRLAVACVLAALAPAVVVQAGQGPAGTGEAGGASVLLQFNRSSNPAPLFWKGPLVTFLVPSTSYADLRVESYHFVPNWGKLQASADLTNTPEGFSPGRATVRMSQVPVGGWSLDVSAGDRPLTVYSLDFKLSSLFSPFAGLRGGQVTASRGGTAISVFGGRTTASGGLFGDTALVSNQHLYGARATFSPLSTLEVAASLVTTSAAGAQSWLPLPRSTTTLTTDVTYSPTSSVALMGEASLSRYAGAPGLQQAAGQDLSYVLGSRVGSQGRSVEVSAVRLGPLYMPLSSFNLGDRKGVYASGNYAFTEALQMFGGLSRFHDNLLRSSDRPTYSVDHAFLGGRVRLAPASHLGARLSQGGVESDSSVSRLSSRNRDVLLDFTQQLGVWRVLVRGSAIRSSDDAAGLEHSRRRRADVEVRRVWKNGTSVWTTIGTVRETTGETGHTQSSTAGNAGLSGSIRGVSVYGEASWNEELGVLRTSRVRNAAFNGGLNWRMPGGFRVSVSGRFSRDSSTLSLYDQAVLTPESVIDLQAFLVNQRRRAYQFNVTVQKDLRWGRRPVAASAPGAAPKPVDVGSLAGSVFNDLDRDGLRNGDEQGVPYSAVVLDGLTRQEVDATGAFLFKNVPVGEHTVELELSTIPASYDVGPRPKATLRVTRRGTAEVSFPLIQLGKVTGRIVVIDRTNPDRPWQDDFAAKRRDGVGRDLIVVLNDRFKVTIADGDGEFEFRGIPAGDYRVRLDASSLPDLWEVVSEPGSSVTLPPGGRVSDLLIVVGVHARPARRVILTSQSSPPSPRRDEKP